MPILFFFTLETPFNQEKSIFINGLDLIFLAELILFSVEKKC